MKDYSTLFFDDKRFAIYGTGDIANITYLYLMELGLDDKVDFFIVSEKSKDVEYKFGKRILCFDEVNHKLSRTKILIAVQRHTLQVIKSLLDEFGFSDYIMIDNDWIRDKYYDLLYKNPIQQNKIIFFNMNGMGYGCNSKYIAEELIRRDEKEKFDIVWAIANDSKYHFPNRIRETIIGSSEYYQEMATAKIWVNNVRMRADVKKRPGQFYIQAWHGAAPIKMVEKDAEESLPQTYLENAKRDSGMADLFLSGSKFYTELYKQSFWYDGEIMEVGLPRHDAFWKREKVKEKIFRKYDIPLRNKMILYSPTYRDNVDINVYDIDVEKVTWALSKKFNYKFSFAASKHPLNLNLNYPFAENKNVIDVSTYEDFEELLMAADVLISDYSGCMYDFLFTECPIFLYQKDYYQYMASERNFYISFENAPFIRAQTNEELEKKILSFDENSYRNDVYDFMDRFGNFDTGQASSQIADWIISKIGSVR